MAILLGILLLAVQGARESSRRLRCVNNSRQIGIALNNYSSSTSGWLPPGAHDNGFSFYTEILSYIDQQNIHNSINFNNSPMIRSGYFSNITVSHISISILICPSDYGAYPSGGGTNYAGNRGYGFDGPSIGPTPRDNGAFFKSSVSIRDISDGLSSTATVAEWASGAPNQSTRDPISTIFETSTVADFDHFTTDCQNLDVQNADVSTGIKGSMWLRGDFIYSLYNHDLNVNGRSCTNKGNVQTGAWTAASRHSGGANVLFTDGHVSFIKSTVSTTVWRALGTRNGSEISAGAD